MGPATPPESTATATSAGCRPKAIAPRAKDTEVRSAAEALLALGGGSLGSRNEPLCPHWHVVNYECDPEAKGERLGTGVYKRIKIVHEVRRVGRTLHRPGLLGACDENDGFDGDDEDSLELYESDSDSSLPELVPISSGEENGGDNNDDGCDGKEEEEEDPPGADSNGDNRCPPNEDPTSATTAASTEAAAPSPGRSIAVIDSGGGRRPTVTEDAWLEVGNPTGLVARLGAYPPACPPAGKNDSINDSDTHEETEPFCHRVCSAVTKASIRGRSEPVLFLVHGATYVSGGPGRAHCESLLTTMDMGDHGVAIHGMHPSGDRCGMTVRGGDYLPFDWDDEKLFFAIEKPSPSDLSRWPVYELNSPHLRGEPFGAAVADGQGAAR
ncbi:unnamed protein product [Pseudo-nitzschia multistriata]|uniref:Uncharacterized protein n=1 Tax=Pseudo-nitzschia multistriata TaxID=183589 RepID=A0A448YV62_9STRA|nr:unnamed protein product [Pseudo-nitzschia multistriata]